MRGTVAFTCALALSLTACLRNDQACELDQDCQANQVCQDGLCAPRTGGGGDAGGVGVDSGDDASTPADVGADGNASDVGDAGAPDDPFEILDDGQILEPVRAAMLSDGRMLAVYLVSVGQTESTELRVVERDQEGAWGDPVLLRSFADTSPYDVVVGERADGALILLSLQEGDLLSFSRLAPGQWGDAEVALARGPDLAGVCQSMSARIPMDQGIGCVRPRLVDTESGTPFTPGLLSQSAIGYVFEQVAPEHDPGLAASYASSVELIERPGGGSQMLYRRKVDQIEVSERDADGGWRAPRVAVGLAASEPYTRIATRMDAALGASGDVWVAYSLSGNINDTKPILRVSRIGLEGAQNVVDVLGATDRFQREPAIDAGDTGAVYVTYNSYANADGDDGQLRMTVLRAAAIDEVVLDEDTGNSLSSAVIVDEIDSSVHVVYARSAGDTGQLVYRRWTEVE